MTFPVPANKSTYYHIFCAQTLTLTVMLLYCKSAGIWVLLLRNSNFLLPDFSWSAIRGTVSPYTWLSTLQTSGIINVCEPAVCLCKFSAETVRYYLELLKMDSLKFASLLLLIMQNEDSRVHPVCFETTPLIIIQIIS